MPPCSARCAELAAWTRVARQSRSKAASPGPAHRGLNCPARWGQGWTSFAACRGIPASPLARTAVADCSDGDGALPGHRPGRADGVPRLPDRRAFLERGARAGCRVEAGNPPPPVPGLGWCAPVADTTVSGLESQRLAPSLVLGSLDPGMPVVDGGPTLRQRPRPMHWPRSKPTVQCSPLGP